MVDILELHINQAVDGVSHSSPKSKDFNIFEKQIIAVFYIQCTHVTMYFAIHTYVNERYFLRILRSLYFLLFTLYFDICFLKS